VFANGPTYAAAGKTCVDEAPSLDGTFHTITVAIPAAGWIIRPIYLSGNMFDLSSHIFSIEDSRPE